MDLNPIHFVIVWVVIESIMTDQVENRSNQMGHGL